MRLKAWLLGDQTRVTLVLGHEQRPDERIELGLSGQDAKQVHAWLQAVEKMVNEVADDQVEAMRADLTPVDAA